MVPLIILAWIVILGALVVFEERERRPAIRYKAPAPMSDTAGGGKPRDLISATPLAGAMAGLPPVMTSAAQ